MSAKPKKLERATIEALARQAQADLDWCEKHAGEISANACDWMDDGRQGVNYDAVRRGGDSSSAPERYALAAIEGRSDQGFEIVESFRRALIGARQSALLLRKAAQKLVLCEEQRDDRQNRDASSAAALSQKQPGAGACIVCGDMASGIGNDRLRSGRCDPCRQYRLRHGVDRPKELWSQAS